MSDTYYQERAARRTRTLLIGGGMAVVIACIIAGIASLFYDACTKGFDRSPEAVVTAFVEAVRQGDVEVAQECWEHEAYYDLEAGCSEVCLSRAYGAQYDIADMVVDSPYTTPEGRANLKATVSIVCQDGQPHAA